MAAARTLHTGADTQRELWPEAVVERLRFGRAPLLAAALCFATGIVLARHWHPAIVLLIAMMLLVALIWPGLRGSAWASVAAVAAMWIAIGVACAELQPASGAQQELLTYADGLSRTVHGHVIRIQELPAAAPGRDVDTEGRDWTQPQSEDQPEGQPVALSLDLSVDAIEQVTPDVAWMVPVAGGVRVTVIGPAAAFACGDIVEAPLRLKIPERYRDPGAWQYADYLLDQGIGARGSVKAARLSRLGMDAAHWSTMRLRCRLYGGQAWAAGQLVRYVHSRANHTLPAVMRLGPDDAGMLNAMLFGDRTRLSHTLRVGFERTGSFHLFVVSGMHVGLLAAGVFWLARRLRLGDLSATLLTITLTAGYALLTGFGAPVQRALAMATLFLLTRLLSRDRSVLNALGAAALGVLAWSPRSLFEASFQMTFLAIVAIAGMAIPLGEWSFLPYARVARRIDDRWLDVGMPPRLAQLRVMLRVFGEPLTRIFGRRALGVPALFFRWSLWALELSLIGVVAEMVMVLPMALYFHRATVFALPANMLSIPLVAVLAPAAVFTFLTSLVSPWLAAIPGAGTALLLHGIVGLIGRISRAHTADLRTPGPGLWVALCVTGCWAFCCWAVRRSRRWAAVATFILPLAAAVVLWPEPPVVSPGLLEVTAIDVGQGDSLLIVSPTGQSMLMDAGGPIGAIKESADATSRFDVGEEVVSPYLWSRRIRRLDVLALSHAHSDHMGGMAAVMRNFRPRELWVSIDPSSTAYSALLLEAKDLGVVVRHVHAGDNFGWAGVDAEVLAPASSYTNVRAPTNDDSLVLRLQYRQASVLLAGDAEAASERAMLRAGLVHPVTLLKVGHHGSRTSTSAAFLADLTPRDAIISVGRNNTFGHPRPEIIARFAEAGTHLYRTDEFGLITFLLGPDGQIKEVIGAADH